MDLTTLQRLVALIGGVASGYLLLVLVIAFLTMAFLQTAKDLFPLRRKFQRFFLLGWLKGKAQEFSDGRRRLPLDIDVDESSDATPRSRITALPGVVDHEAAERELVQLLASGDRRSFYDLPIEQLCGQMATASGVVLDFPQKYSPLLLCLASLADPNDLKTVIENTASPEDLAALKGTERKQYQDLIDARNRLMHQVQRSIDSFQIRTGYRWKWCLQVASLLIAIVTTLLLMLTVAALTWQGVATAVPLAIVAGFLAPIMRDLLTRLVSTQRG